MSHNFGLIIVTLLHSWDVIFHDYIALDYHYSMGIRYQYQQVYIIEFVVYSNKVIWFDRDDKDVAMNSRQHQHQHDM